MADFIRAPWIRDYLVEVAETYGGDLVNLPYHKRKKGQFVKFLTAEQEGDENDGWVWAQLSDTQYMLPVRLSKEAMKAYYERPGMPIGKLSVHKTVFVIIQGFRAMFSRVPMGKGMPMSEKSMIALEVTDFQLMGSRNEDIIGKPCNVLKDELLAEWCAGLDAGGGGGNVLKLRAQERKKEIDSVNPVPAKKDRVTTLPFKAVPKAKPQKWDGGVGRRMDAVKEFLAQTHATRSKVADPTKMYRRHWHSVKAHFSRYSTLYEGFDDLPEAPFVDSDGSCEVPQDENKSLHEPDAVPEPDKSRPSTPQLSPPRASIPPSQCPQTPSHWSPSVRASSLPRSPTPASPMAVDIVNSNSQNTPEPEIEVPPMSSKEHDLDREQVLTPSPSLAPPTPAQRPKPQASRSPSPHRRPQTPTPPDSTKATQGTPSRTKQKCYSRRPVSDRPLKSLYADFTSKGKILAPNSDTSGTGSSQMRSQSLPVLSQSQSMGGSQGLLRYSQSLSYVTASVRESQEEGKMVRISQERSQGRSQSQRQSQLKNEVLEEMEVDADVTEDHHPGGEAVQEGLVVSEPKEQGDAMSQLEAPLQVSEEKGPQDIVMQTNSPSSKPAPAAENSETESETEEEDDVYDQLSVGEFEVAVKPEEEEEEVDMLQAEEEEEESLNIDMLKEEEEESQQRAENLDEGPKPDSPVRKNLPDPAVIVSPEIPLPTTRPQTLSQSSSSRARPRAARKAPANFHGSPARPQKPSGPDVLINEVPLPSLPPRRSSPPPGASLPSPKAITEKVSPPAALPPIADSAPPPKDVVPEPPPPTHDIVAWSNPSFLRNREEQRNQQEKMASAKKRAHPPLDSSDEEPPTPKRRKVASRLSVSRQSHPSTTLPKPSAPDTSVQENPAAPVQRNDSLASTTSRIRKIDLRRSGSVSSTSSLKRTEGKRATALSFKPIPPQPTRATREGVSATTESQVAVAPSKPTETKPKGSESPEPPRLHSCVKGKSRAEPMIPVSKPSVAARSSFQFLPGVAALKNSPQPSRAQENVSSRKSSVSSTPGPKASSSPQNRKEGTQKPPLLTSTPPAARPVYRIETTMKQENGSPPVTWSVLDGILLRVGRARFKEEKKKKGAGG